MLSSYGKHFSFPTLHIQKPFKPPKTDPRFVQRYHVKRGEERKIIILKFKLTSLACEWKDGFCRKRTDGGNGEKGSYEILHIDSSIPRYKSAQLRKGIPKLREEFIIYTHFHAPSGFGFPQTTHNSHTSQLYTRHGATNQLGILERFGRCIGYPNVARLFVSWFGKFIYSLSVAPWLITCD